MKISELKSDNGTTKDPCALVSNYLLWEQDGGTLQTWLEQFEYESREEIEKAIRHFIRTVTLDPFMRKKHLEEEDAYAATVFTRYSKIMTDANRYDKYPVTLSGEMWHGGYSRRRLEQRTREMFSVIPDEAKFAAACERIKSVYSLSDTDIEKLHFFVEQVKAEKRGVVLEFLRNMLPHIAVICLKRDSLICLVFPKGVKRPVDRLAPEVSLCPDEFSGFEFRVADYARPFGCAVTGKTVAAGI